MNTSRRLRRFAATACARRRLSSVWVGGSMQTSWRGVTVTCSPVVPLCSPCCLSDDGWAKRMVREQGSACNCRDAGVISGVDHDDGDSDDDVMRMMADGTGCFGVGIGVGAGVDDGAGCR